MKRRVLVVYLMSLILLCACRPEPYVEVDKNLYESLALMLEIKECNMNLKYLEYYDYRMYIHYENTEVSNRTSELEILKYTKEWLEFYREELYSYYLENDLCNIGDSITIEIVIRDKGAKTTLDDKNYIGNFTDTKVSDEWEFFVRKNSEEKEVLILEE